MSKRTIDSYVCCGVIVLISGEKFMFHPLSIPGINRVASIKNQDPRLSATSNNLSFSERTGLYDEPAIRMLNC